MTQYLSAFECVLVCAVVQLAAGGQTAKVASSFSQDEQLVYGVSWAHDSTGLLATASFYDRRLRLWREPDLPADQTG